MARQYSHTQFFRQTPNALLARYFQQHHQVIKELDFDKLKESDITPIFEAKAFEYGEESMADILYGLQLEYRVLRELAQVRYEYIKQKIRFMKATGLITDENMIEVNHWLQALPS